MKNIHFLLRYSNRLANGADTLAEHQAIIRQHGAVWLGKFGIGMGYRFAELAKKQIDNKTPCILYLMNGSKLSAKSNVIDLTAGLKPGGIVNSRSKSNPSLLSR
ncbi:hypothetical protein [Aeromonas rivipollensis]|uniref:hypothetical protein n=1 Tax=Aeromonas rivipollensis TaxID=948519 RepID=UPI003D25E00E